MHSRPTLPRYLGSVEGLGDRLVMVLGKWSLAGDLTVMESDESSVSGVSGMEERSISAESSINSTFGGGKNDMSGGWMLLE